MTAFWRFSKRRVRRHGVQPGDAPFPAVWATRVGVMATRRSGALAVLAAVILVWCAAAAQAQGPNATSMRPPTGELTIVVPDADASGSQSIVLTPDDFLLLPPHTLHTSTVVTDGVVRFDGVLMRHLPGIPDSGKRIITARALNDYEADIPLADIRDFDVMVAWMADGRVLTESGKGPFWIVYPRDQHIQLQDIRYDYRWVWQLNSLHVQ